MSGCYDVLSVREAFPILGTTVYGRPLVYLDNAATTQKPRAVLDAMVHHFTTDCANIHRGVHTLSQRATARYEAVRGQVRAFLGARAEREIVFTSGTTDGINLVAQTYGRHFVQAGDAIVVSQLEHHSNIVPWQMLCTERGAELRVIPCDDTGTLDLDAYRALLADGRVKLCAFGHVSNALGTVHPVAEMVALAKAHGAVTLVDGAQAVAHTAVDVTSLDCDFYAFSGHKLYGPTGVGVLYMRSSWQDRLPPWRGGGDMIKTVSFDGTVFADPPAKFEAGTPPIAEVIGLGAAIDFVRAVGLEAIAAHEHAILDYALQQLVLVPGVRLIGTPTQRAGAISFVMRGIHPHDVGTILDTEGVAVRAGHHCAEPAMRRFGVPATARASVACTTTRGEIDTLVRGLEKVWALLGDDAA